MHEVLLSRRRAVALIGVASLNATRAVHALNTPLNNVAASEFVVLDFHRIYDPSVGEKEAWYINDHTFIQGKDGTWHLFGITHTEPAAPQQEKFFAHATAPDLVGPWTKQKPVLQVSAAQGETVVWAPYVLEHGGRYWMFYCGGGDDHAKYRIQLATSTDLWSWERALDNPMVLDGVDARDPMAIRFDDHWLLYYTATTTPQGGNHNIFAVTSKDMHHWSDRREVFRSYSIGTYGGPTESPFVVEHNGKYYLFACTNAGYNETTVYKSDSPLHWTPENIIGKYPAHASEVIQTSDGKWYVSRAGWGQGGVYLAELTWKS